jgi:tRNA pseudouridine55 synthase
MNPTTHDGLLILDKPPGMTSRAALDRAARCFPRRTRIGHTGTLDPLASGVLVLCLGNATRLTEYVQNMSKTYLSRFLLGARSDTDDADGVITPTIGAEAPAPGLLAAHVAQFLGTIEQVPPAFSAAKITGRRAYDMARRGEAVELAPRPVRVDAINVLHYDFPVLDVEVHCGKGTYIRSLARDLGDRLGSGAYVQDLRRTRVGPFMAEGALTLECEPEAARARLLPMQLAVAELPRTVLSPDDVKRFCQGQAIALPEIAAGGIAGKIAVFDNEQRLLAVAEYDVQKQVLRPAKVLASRERQRPEECL